MKINTTASIFLFSLSFSLCLVSLSQQNTQKTEGEVTLSPRAEPLVEVNVSGLLASGDYKGQIICSANNALYTAAGLEWPWDNVLQLYSIEARQVKSQFYTASRGRYDFAFEPRWLNQNEFGFKMGDLISSYSTYDLAVWNSLNSTVEVANRNLFIRTFSTSRNTRFVAFVQGGRALPFGAPVEQPSLAAFDREQKTTRRLPFSSPDLSGMGWTSQNKLLYTERNILPEEQVESMIPVKASIREFDPSNGGSRLFRSNAFTPFVSPDGNWIAYFAFDNPFPEEKIETTVEPDPTLPTPTSPLYLVLADETGKPVRTIAENRWGYLPILRWSADNEKVIVYTRRRRQIITGGAEMEGTISSYGLKEKELKIVGNIRYFAPAGTEMNDNELLCRPINLTKDGRFLLFEIQQSSTTPSGTTLTAFDLTNGTRQNWFFISAFQGLDWIED